MPWVWLVAATSPSAQAPVVDSAARLGRALPIGVETGGWGLKTLLAWKPAGACGFIRRNCAAIADGVPLRWRGGSVGDGGARQSILLSRCAGLRPGPRVNVNGGAARAKALPPRYDDNLKAIHAEVACVV